MIDQGVGVREIRSDARHASWYFSSFSPRRVRERRDREKESVVSNESSTAGRGLPNTSRSRTVQS